MRDEKEKEKEGRREEENTEVVRGDEGRGMGERRKG